MQKEFLWPMGKVALIYGHNHIQEGDWHVQNSICLFPLGQCMGLGWDLEPVMLVSRGALTDTDEKTSSHPLDWAWGSQWRSWRVDWRKWGRVAAPWAEWRFGQPHTPGLPETKPSTQEYTWFQPKMWQKNALLVISGRRGPWSLSPSPLSSSNCQVPQREH